jgi:hypothetical protein
MRLYWLFADMKRERVAVRVRFAVVDTRVSANGNARCTPLTCLYELGYSSDLHKP